MRDFWRRRVFGVYGTTAAAEAKPLGPEEQRNTGLTSTKMPVRPKIALVNLLLEAGFLDEALEEDATAGEGGDADAPQRPATAQVERWRQRLTD